MKYPTLSPATIRRHSFLILTIAAAGAGWMIACSGTVDTPGADRGAGGSSGDAGSQRPGAGAGGEAGANGAKVIATYLVEKGQPLANP